MDFACGEIDLRAAHILGASAGDDRIVELKFSGVHGVEHEKNRHEFRDACGLVLHVFVARGKNFAGIGVDADLSGAGEGFDCGARSLDVSGGARGNAFRGNRFCGDRFGDRFGRRRERVERREQRRSRGCGKIFCGNGSYGNGVLRERRFARSRRGAVEREHGSDRNHGAGNECDGKFARRKFHFEKKRNALRTKIAGRCRPCSALGRACFYRAFA